MYPRPDDASMPRRRLQATPHVRQCVYPRQRVRAVYPRPADGSCPADIIDALISP